MLKTNDLLELRSMPLWPEISLTLYKQFAQQYLIPTVFRYHLKNNKILDVKFTEWSIYHLLGMQHIDGKIRNTDFFHKIDEGLDFGMFTENRRTKKRFNDYKLRIRMFSCVYSIMCTADMFFVKSGQIEGKSVKADYLKHALIDGKGVNIGIRNINGNYKRL